jgi:hypothetical protein
VIFFEVDNWTSRPVIKKFVIIESDDESGVQIGEYVAVHLSDASAGVGEARNRANHSKSHWNSNILVLKRKQRCAHLTILPRARLLRMTTPKLNVLPKFTSFTKSSAYVVGVKANGSTPALAESTIDLSPIQQLDLGALGVKHSPEVTFRLPAPNGAIYLLVVIGD